MTAQTAYSSGGEAPPLLFYVKHVLIITYNVILITLLIINIANAQDCCPGLRSSEGELLLGIEQQEIAVAGIQAAGELWREQLGFTVQDWHELPDGRSTALISFADGTSLRLIHCSSALDRRARHYEAICSAGGGPADLILAGTPLEHIRYALEAVEEPLEFIDSRTKIELVLPRDATRQPLRFVEYFLPEQAGTRIAQHPNAAGGIRSVWLETDELARDLLLLELLGGSDEGETVTAKGSATVVQMQQGSILLHSGSANGVIGISFSVAELERAAGAMQLPGPDGESIIGGPGSRFSLTPKQTGGLWLEFVETAN